MKKKLVPVPFPEAFKQFYGDPREQLLKPLPFRCKCGAGAMDFSAIKFHIEEGHKIKTTKVI